VSSAVLLLEDHPIYRDALRRIVESTEEFRVAAALGTVEELRGWSGAEAPALAIVDLFLPDGDGIQCLRELRRRWAALRAIVLTAYADEWNLERAREAGAAGFLEKTAPPDAVLGALRAAVEGRSTFPRARAARSEQGSGDYAARTRLHRLSPRERDVARLVAAGCSNGQIAETLFISPGTVKIHVSRLYEKLGLHDRSKAVVYLLEHKSLLE
jgi:DNA-binding NarL/FixJ family response regulator